MNRIARPNTDTLPNRNFASPSCVVHGPIYGRFMGFYVNGFLYIYDTELNEVLNDDHPSFNSSLCSSHIWFSYFHNFIIILSQIYNEPIQRPAPSWLVSLHRYRRGQGFESVQAWIFFRLSFRNCKSCVYNCDDHPSFNSSLRSSHIWFSYIHNFNKLLVKTKLNSRIPLLFSARIPGFNRVFFTCVRTWRPVLVKIGKYYVITFSSMNYFYYNYTKVFSFVPQIIVQWYCDFFYCVLRIIFFIRRKIIFRGIADNFFNYNTLCSLRLEGLVRVFDFLGVHFENFASEGNGWVCPTADTYVQ